MKFEADGGSGDSAAEDYYYGSSDASGNEGSEQGVEFRPSSPIGHFESTKLNYDVWQEDEVEIAYMKFINTAKAISNMDPIAAHVIFSETEWRMETLNDFYESPSSVFKKIKRKPFDTTDDFGKCNVESSPEFLCPILDEIVQYSHTNCAACCHRFSINCWKGYLENALKEKGPFLAKTLCPDLDCPFIVPKRIWDISLDASILRKFHSHLLKDFVDTNPNLRFCRNPKCDKILHVQKEDPLMEVSCICGESMCFQCGDESHRPVPCDIPRLWAKKNQDSSLNVTYILLKTKQCNKCKSDIEKDRGCMHMTCRCGHQFCWICMTEWNSGHRCNEYTVPEEAPDSQKQRASQSLDRYTHFYERYRFHKKGMEESAGPMLEKTKSNMEVLQTELGELTSTTFLEEAVKQITGCRKMLMWSYAFGYFAIFSKEKKKLYEFHQGQLEEQVDLLLQDIIKFEIEKYMSEQRSSYDPFFTFKQECYTRTKAVANFFDNMKEAFEKDFVGVPLMENDDILTFLSG